MQETRRRLPRETPRSQERFPPTVPLWHAIEFVPGRVELHVKVWAEIVKSHHKYVDDTSHKMTPLNDSYNLIPLNIDDTPAEVMSKRGQQSARWAVLTLKPLSVQVGELGAYI